MKLFFALALLSLTGCSHITFKMPQSFQVNKVWVRSSLSQDNLEFRKINRNSPILIDDLLIQANSIDGIVAYDKNSGRQIWKMPIENGVEPSFARIRDRVFVAASDGKVYSIEGRTGNVVWSFDTKAENLGTPFLNEGTVYFISGASVLYALDAATGRQLWVYSHQDASSFSIRGMSQPVVYKGMLYAGFADGTLLAFESKTGAIKWQVGLNKNKRFRDIDAQPVVDQDQLYVPGFDDKLYVLSPSTGAVLWKLDYGGYSGVTMSDKMIFYPTSQGELLALNKADGQRIWSYKLASGIPTQVQLYKGLVVFGESQGSVRFLDMNTGKEVGSFSPGRGVLAAPLVDEQSSRVYFISGESNVWALEAAWKRKSDWP